MQVHQLSVNYEQAQDRILARINTTTGEELRVWLTRRLCLNLWPSLNKAVAEFVLQKKSPTDQVATPMGHADDTTRQMMADFERQDSLKNADFKTPYKAQPTLLPLGPEPLVVAQMKLNTLASGLLQFDFKEKLPGQAPRGFQLGMAEQTLHGFVHLLDKALSRAGWHGDATGSTRAASAIDDEKPKYLN